MEDLLSLLEVVLGESEKKSHGNYRFHCPLPNCTSIRKRLEIQTETDAEGHNPWKCWVCNGKGASIRSLFKQGKVDPQYYSRLKAIIPDYYTGVSVVEQEEIIALPDEFRLLQDVRKSDMIGRQALAYVKRRGISPEEIIKYQLGYCDKGQYRSRIIIPSFDANGTLNYFTGRSFIEDEERRYSQPSIKRGDIIPFEFYVNWNAPIILCEGFFDAIAIRRNAIPLLEKGITQCLLTKILGSSVEKIYIVLDKDGMKEALEHADMLLANGKKVYLVELDKKDPGGMGFDEFTTMIQKAKSLDPGTLFMKKMSFKLS